MIKCPAEVVPADISQFVEPVPPPCCGADLKSLSRFVFFFVFFKCLTNHFYNVYTFVCPYLRS